MPGVAKWEGKGTCPAALSGWVTGSVEIRGGKEGGPGTAIP